MKYLKKVILILFLSTVLFFSGCFLVNTFFIRPINDTASSEVSFADEELSYIEAEDASEPFESPEEPEPETTPEPIEPPFEEYDISLMAVGDNLIHMGVVHTGKQSDGTYDYRFLFEGISPFLDVADIKIINQETVLGGNERGFSGFPYFNSPTEIGDAIVDAGFNIVLQASNHSADQDLDGLLHCAGYWDNQADILMSGIHSDATKTSDFPILTIKDISFAILNYTYGPNLEVLPKNLEGHLNLLCDYDKSSYRMDFTSLNPRVLEDIAAAKEMADIVIVCPHWGTEYTTTPSRYQESFAKEMTAAGADLIIGTHPHVVQPVEWITADNGNRALCYYSLGNYVSTQKEGLCMLEGMAWTTFHVTEDNIFIQEENTGILPMVCHYTAGPVRIENIYLLEDYTAEQASSHGIRSYGGVNLTLDDLQTWSNETLGEWILSKEKVLSP